MKRSSLLLALVFVTLFTVVASGASPASSPPASSPASVPASSPASAHSPASTPASAPSPSSPNSKDPLDTLGGLAWILFSVLIVGVIGFSYGVVQYYTDRHETEMFPFIVTVASLAVTLFALVVVPIDVYLSAGYPSGHMDAISAMYYILYSVIVFFCFVLLPFAYFYYEEDDEDVTVKQRMMGACKYTSFLLVICILLFIIGAFIKTGDKSKFDGDAIEHWADKIVSDDKNVLTFSIGFAVACLTLIGYLCWISYTAYGLSALPIGLMRRPKNVKEEQSDLNQTLNVTREKKRAVQSKYLSGKKMSKKDEKTLSLLSRQERVLGRQSARIEEKHSKLRQMLIILRPFAFLAGILFLLLSALLFFSLFMSQLDRVLNSSCGSTCSYVLSQPWAYNPLDSILSALAPYFPIDMILFSSMMLYVFVATMSGVVKLGVRVLWVKLYSIRRRRSPPQGLMLMSIILVLSSMALNASLLTLAPQYTSYGRQTVTTPTGGTVPCSRSDPPGVCETTVLAKLYDTIALNMSFFGNAFYWMTWVFLGFVLLGTAFSVFRRISNVQSNESDSDESENF